MLESLAEKIDGASPWQFWGFLGVVALLTLWFFYRGFSRLRLARLIEDTPTSLIRSAHQGYVELEGRAVALPGAPIYAPLSGRSCVWYEYTIDHLETRWYGGRRRSAWVSLERARSEAIFALQDGTGQCVIDPEGADIQCAHSISWQGHERYPYNTPPGHSDFAGPYRYTERLIEPDDSLYVLGWFKSLRDPAQSGLKAKTSELLLRWKRSPEKLLERFDLNRDGQIDQREWEIVRRQAEKEALRAQGDNDETRRPVHLLGKPPREGIPFIIAGQTQEVLTRSFRRQSVATLILFVVGCAAIAWALQERFN